MTDTEAKTFDDTSPFKEAVLGDKPNTHEVVIANKSEVKDFYDPLTHIRFELKTETTVRIKGDLAHKQFLANIEQINTLNGSTQLVVSSDTNIDGNDGNSGGSSEEDIRVTGVTVTPKTKTMTPFTTANLTANIQPSNATKQGLVWVSDNPDVVKVDQSGAIRSVAVGKANITVTTDGGGYTATTKVTVKSEGASVTVTSSNGNTIAYTETTQLTATVAPDTVTDKSVTWESSDTKIATVDANGLVTGVAMGNVTITATSVADSTNSGSIDLNLGAPS